MRLRVEGSEGLGFQGFRGMGLRWEFEGLRLKVEGFGASGQPSQIQDFGFATVFRT